MAKNADEASSGIEHKEFIGSDISAVLQAADEASDGMQVTMWAKLDGELFPNVYTKDSSDWIDSFGYKHPSDSIFAKMSETLIAGGFEVAFVFS